MLLSFLSMALECHIFMKANDAKQLQIFVKQIAGNNSSPCDLEILTYSPIRIGNKEKIALLYLETIPVFSLLLFIQSSLNQILL